MKPDKMARPGAAWRTEPSCPCSLHHCMISHCKLNHIFFIIFFRLDPVFLFHLMFTFCRAFNYNTVPSWPERMSIVNFCSFLCNDFQQDHLSQIRKKGPRT